MRPNTKVFLLPGTAATTNPTLIKGALATSTVFTF